MRSRQKIGFSFLQNRKSNNNKYNHKNKALSSSLNDRHHRSNKRRKIVLINLNSVGKQNCNNLSHFKAIRKTRCISKCIRRNMVKPHTILLSLSKLQRKSFQILTHAMRIIIRKMRKKMATQKPKTSRILSRQSMKSKNFRR